LATTVGGDVEVQRAADARPSDLTNLDRIGGLDELVLLVCVLLAFVTLANGLVIATRARARDHRVMRALGADPSTVAGSVRWHTAIVVAISAAVGVPLGTIAGLLAWHRTAHAVFVGDALHRPVTVTLAILAGLVVAGVAVAETTGASAARRSRRRITAE
jgi:predicted lysophospholipase L1 biosynthesis ABC-type transport system permease subunit